MREFVEIVNRYLEQHMIICYTYLLTIKDNLLANIFGMVDKMFYANNFTRFFITKKFMAISVVKVLLSLLLV